MYWQCVLGVWCDCMWGGVAGEGFLVGFVIGFSLGLSLGLRVGILLECVDLLSFSAGGESGL